MFWGKALASMANILDTNTMTGADSSLEHCRKAGKQTHTLNMKVVLEQTLGPGPHLSDSDRHTLCQRHETDTERKRESERERQRKRVRERERERERETE